MECKHERIQSVNCVISCMDCGKLLDASVLMKKGGNQAGESTGTDKPHDSGSGRREGQRNRKDGNGSRKS